MKKIIGVILSAVMISGMSSCSGGETEQAENSSGDITTVSAEPSAEPEETGEDVSKETTGEAEKVTEADDRETTVSEVTSYFTEDTSGSQEDSVEAVSDSQTESAAETSGTTAYNKEVSILSGDKTLKRPSEEFLRKAFSEKFNENGTVVFCLNSDGTYFVPGEGTYYQYTNEDNKFAYDTIVKNFDRDYYEENKEKFKERDHVSNYEEYIKQLENFYGEEWMDIYRTYDPDNIETVVHFVIYPSAYGSDFTAGSSDYSNEEIFLKLAEQLFNTADLMTYAMTDRLESGENFYVRAEAEYKGDNVIKYRSAFGDTPYEVSVTVMERKSSKYFTMDGSELPEEYKDKGY